MGSSLLGLWFVFLLAGPPLKAAPDGGAAAARQQKAQLRKFRATMAEAKKAAKKGNHAAAIAAYDRALTLRPGDLAALTDQGWSAFLLPDLTRAEKITRQAVEAVGEGRIRGAAFYNLGRILEAKKDRAGAIAAYQRSLDFRPNRVVREQLATLDPAAAAAADPLRPKPMRGPFASLADFCKTLEDKEARAECPAEGAGAALTRVGAPYQEVRWIQAGIWEGTCFVAVELAKGWFVDAIGDYCHDANGFVERTVVSFEVTDLVPGGHREVVLRTSDNHSERESVDEEDSGLGSPLVIKECDSWLTACGVSKAGVPSCLHMQTGKAEFCRDDGSAPWRWQLQPVFTSDGQVEVKGTGKLDADAKGLLGKRTLAFP